MTEAATPPRPSQASQDHRALIMEEQQLLAQCQAARSRKENLHLELTGIDAQLAIWDRRLIELRGVAHGVDVGRRLERENPTT